MQHLSVVRNLIMWIVLYKIMMGGINPISGFSGNVFVKIHF